MRRGAARRYDRGLVRVRPTEYFKVEGQRYCWEPSIPSRGDQPRPRRFTPETSSRPNKWPHVRRGAPARSPTRPSIHTSAAPDHIDRLRTIERNGPVVRAQRSVPGRDVQPLAPAWRSARCASSQHPAAWRGATAARHRHDRPGPERRPPAGRAHHQSFRYPLSPRECLNHGRGSPRHGASRCAQIPASRRTLGELVKLR